MNVLHWLTRRLRRVNRAAEETAVAASVVQSGPTPQVNAMGAKAVLGEIEQEEQEAQE